MGKMLQINADTLRKWRDMAMDGDDALGDEIDNFLVGAGEELSVDSDDEDDDKLDNE